SGPSRPGGPRRCCSFFSSQLQVNTKWTLRAIGCRPDCETEPRYLCDIIVGVRRLVPFLLVLASSCGSEKTSNSNAWHRVSDTPEPRYEWAAVSDGSRLYCIGGIIDLSPARNDPKPSDHVDILAI